MFLTEDERAKKHGRIDHERYQKQMFVIALLKFCGRFWKYKPSAKRIKSKRPKPLFKWDI